MLSNDWLSKIKFFWWRNLHVFMCARYSLCVCGWCIMGCIFLKFVLCVYERLEEGIVSVIEKFLQM